MLLMSVESCLTTLFSQGSIEERLLGLESVASVYRVENVLSSQPCVVQRGLNKITRVITFFRFLPCCFTKLGFLFKTVFQCVRRLNYRARTSF